MSLVAGDVGSKTILPDGAQVDNLSENTVGHGVRVKGRGIGEAVDLTDIGAYMEAIGSLTSLSPNLYSTGGSSGITLQPGVYDLQAVGVITPAASTTLNHIFCAINTTNTDDFTGADAMRNTFSSYHAGIVNAGGDSWRVNTPLYRVVVTTTTTYYPKIRVQFGTSTCSGYANLFARRVA